MNKLINKGKLFLERKKLSYAGKGVQIHYSVRLKGTRSISLGDEVNISRGVSLSGRIKIGDRTCIQDFCIFQTWGGEIEVGKDCTFNPFCVIYGHGGLKIGNGVRVATRVVIAPMNHIYKDRLTPIWKQGIEAKGIVIDDDIWIGAGAIILDGVHIGRGAVVGAGAVVTENVEPYKIVAGVPARVVKER